MKSHFKSLVIVLPIIAISLVTTLYVMQVSPIYSKPNIKNSYEIIPSNQCNGNLIPFPDFKKELVPVLLMRPNSNATICITYHFLDNWESYPNKQVYPNGIVHFGFKIYSNAGGGMESPLFNVETIPDKLNVTDISGGSNMTVMYMIYAESNAKGFYGASVPFDSCAFYPFAVAYGSSQVNATDFTNYSHIPHFCFNAIYNISSVKVVSGMNYTMVNFSR